jgi:hypothetical protein
MAVLATDIEDGPEHEKPSKKADSIANPPRARP